MYLSIYLSIDLLVNHISIYLTIYIYKLISTYQVSSATLESRVFNHMKIVDPPSGIEPGPSTFQAGVQPLHHGAINIKSIYVYILVIIFVTGRDRV